MINIDKIPRKPLDFAILHWWIWSFVVEALKHKSFKFKDYYDIYEEANDFYKLKKHIFNMLFNGDINSCCFACELVDDNCSICIFGDKDCGNLRYGKSDYYKLDDAFINANIEQCIYYAKKIRDWKLK